MIHFILNRARISAIGFEMEYILMLETKFLIEHVLVPLDLKWKINEYEKTVQLSWDHWKKIKLSDKFVL